MVFDPPQRSGKDGARLANNTMAWWHRSKIDFQSKDDWAKTKKPNYGLISDETMDLFSGLLGPHPEIVALSQSHFATSFCGWSIIMPVRLSFRLTGGRGGHRPMVMAELLVSD